MNLSDLKSKGIIGTNFVPREIKFEYVDENGNDETFTGTIYVRRRTVADIDRMRAQKDYSNNKTLVENIRLGENGSEEFTVEDAGEFPQALAEAMFHEIALVNGLTRKEPKN
jgi:hypothetical protein